MESISVDKINNNVKFDIETIEYECNFGKKTSLYSNYDSLVPYYLGNLQLGKKCQVGYVHFEKYFFNLIDLYAQDLTEHFFTHIDFINWDMETVISPGGDLCTKTYLRVELPPIPQEYTNILDSISKTFKANPLVLSDSIRKLTVYDVSKINNFNCVFPKKLKELYICSYSFDYIPKSLPASLKIIAICSCKFNSDISLNNLPDKLEYLYINSNKFSQPVDNLPTQLIVLSILSQKFLQPIDNLPNKLQILHIKTCENIGSLDNLPKTLKCLYLSQRDNLGSLDNLPETLKYLYLSQRDNFVHLLNNLPTGLKSLIIKSPNISSSLDFVPESLELIWINKYTGNFDKYNLPIGLKKINIS